MVTLGSNAAFDGQDPVNIVKSGISKLECDLASSARVSRFYRTPAFPAGAGPDFVNAALAIETDLGAQDVLAILHRIENEAGRVRDIRWGQRSLDMDLIALDGDIIPDLATVRHWMDLPLDQQRSQAPDQLLLPHPRMHERSFVLVPLCDVAPDWKHPILQRSVQQMRDALPAADLRSVQPLAGG